MKPPIFVEICKPVSCHPGESIGYSSDEGEIAKQLNTKLLLVRQIILSKEYVPALAFTINGTSEIIIRVEKGTVVVQQPGMTDIQAPEGSTLFIKPGVLYKLFAETPTVTLFSVSTHFGDPEKY